jgi:hypothetical protein
LPIDERWHELSPSDWDAFARAWLAELRSPATGSDSNVGPSVVMMNFTATPEQQWQFILAAVAHAESDDELKHIAAGPIEHLLGKHGEKYIECVEKQAETDPKFARAISSVWKHLMSDAVWARVTGLKTRCCGTRKPTH